MKRIISAALASLFALSALASCASAPTDTASTSSYADKAWLKERIGDIPDTVAVGTASSLGIDMTGFEDDGYIIRSVNGEVTVAGKNENGLDRAVRRYARMIKYGEGVTDVIYHEGARIEKLTVAGRDIADYTVVYTHTEDVSYPFLGFTKGMGEFAAAEFVRLIEEATGITLPTLDLSTGAKMPSPAVIFEADDSPKAENPYSETGYSYEVKDGNLIFRGSGISGGVANGVYYFLEHECGWQNLTYGDAFLAEADAIDIPEGLSHKGSTMFETCYPYGNSWDPFREGHPQHVGVYYVACHGIQNNHFIDNYDLVTEQPCYSDPLVLENCIENIEMYLDARPDAKDVDIAQPDNDAWCQCKDCRAVFREEGSQAGIMTRFSNAVAEAVDEYRPGLKYLMFAYAQTKRPPAVTKPCDLLAITFCFDGSCYNHALNSGLCTTQVWNTKSLGSGITNATFAKWIEEWSSVCDDMYAWYYTMDGGCTQYNTLHVLYDDMNYLHDLGVKGVFLEGEYYGQGIGRLNFEMLGAMQYEPDMTYEEYLAELEKRVDLYYGEGHYEDFAYVAELLRQSMARRECVTCWCTEQIGNGADYEYMSERLEKTEAALNEMIADAPSYEAELNCKRLSVMVMYESIFGRYVFGDHSDLDYLNRLYDTFAERAVECGFNLDMVILGIAFGRSIAPTLTEEVEYWKTTVKGLE